MNSKTTSVATPAINKVTLWIAIAALVISVFNLSFKTSQSSLESPSGAEEVSSIIDSLPIYKGLSVEIKTYFKPSLYSAKAMTEKYPVPRTGDRSRFAEAQRTTRRYIDSQFNGSLAFKETKVYVAAVIDGNKISRYFGYYIKKSELFIYIDGTDMAPVSIGIIESNTNNNDLNVRLTSREGNVSLTSQESKHY